MSSRALAAAVLAASLAAGLLAGMTWSAFSGQAVSSGNSFTAAASFAPEFVKQLGTQACGGAASSVTVPAGGVAAGNTVVVTLGLRGNVAGTLTVTDSGGNAYTADADVTNGDIRTVVFSSRLSTALAGGDAIVADHPFSNRAQGISAAEFSGVVSGSRVDAAVTGSGTSATPAASLTTGHAYDLLVGAVGNQTNLPYTEHAGWTTLSHIEPNCGGAPFRSTLHSAYRIVSAAGSHGYAPTISAAAPWAEGLVAYKG